MSMNGEGKKDTAAMFDEVSNLSSLVGVDSKDSGELAKNQSNASKPSKPKKLQTWLIAGAVVVVILIIVVAVVLLCKGNQQAAENNKVDDSKVCSSDIINEFNNAISNDQSKLPGIVDKIKGLDKNESDVNCVYMIASTYMSEGDFDKTREEYKRLKKFSEDGKWIDDSVLHVVNMDSFESFLRGQESVENENILMNNQVTTEATTSK